MDTAESFAENLREAPPHRRRALLLDRITAIVADIRQARPGGLLQADQRMLALGLSSLQLIELKHRLEQLFPVDVPVTLFFEHVTLGRLTSYLLSDVLGLDSGPEEVVESPPPGQPARHVEEVARMSESEAEALLLQRIGDLARKPEP